MYTFIVCKASLLAPCFIPLIPLKHCSQQTSSLIARKQSVGSYYPTLRSHVHVLAAMMV